MSLESWKKKYYPVEAVDVSPENALDHSLQKWEGLRPEILTEHALEVVDIYVQEINGSAWMAINSNTCALCVEYALGGCMTCPLFKVLGKKCDSGKMSPYMRFFNDSDPEPMIEALKKCM